MDGEQKRILSSFFHQSASSGPEYLIADVSFWLLAWWQSLRALCRLTPSLTNISMSRYNTTIHFHLEIQPVLLSIFVSVCCIVLVNNATLGAHQMRGKCCEALKTQRCGHAAFHRYYHVLQETTHINELYVHDPKTVFCDKCIGDTTPITSNCTTSGIMM